MFVNVVELGQKKTGPFSYLHQSEAQMIDNGLFLKYSLRHAHLLIARLTSEERTFFYSTPRGD